MNRAVASLLDGFVSLGHGDRVVLVTEGAVPVEEAVLRVLDAAVRARGATVRRVESPPFDPRTEDVPALLAEALAAADVALDFADHESLVHTTTGRRLIRGGTLRFVAVSVRTVEEWSSPFAGFPLSALFARARAAAERLAPGGPSRLVAANGTDLRLRVRAGSVLGMPGGVRPAPMARGVGGFGIFPPGAIGTSPAGAEGTLVLDGFVGIRGALPTPLRLAVEGGVVRRVEGGPEAAWLSERIAAHENGGFVAKVLAGIHPAAPREQGLRELDRRKARLSRAEGVVLVGLGDARSVGGTVASTWHGDGVVLAPVDWDVGGRPLFRAGSLQAVPEIVRADRLDGLGPHRPLLLARAGELAILAVDVRGPMPHDHRNPETDELWVPLEGGPLDARIEGSASIPFGPGRALVVPRGRSHRVDGPERSSPMLVVERVPTTAGAMPGAGTRPPFSSEPSLLDLEALGRSYTLPWTRSSRPVAITGSFVVEAYSRPEGMLRPEERLEAPEAWIVRRGAVVVEEGDGPPSARAEAGAAVALPAGGTYRVVSVAPDTVALRVRCP